MESVNNRLERLLHSDLLSDQDESWLSGYLTGTDLSVLREVASDQFDSDVTDSKMVPCRYDAVEVLSAIHASLLVKRKRNSARTFLNIAALLLIVLGFGFYVSLQARSGLAINTEDVESDIMPGENKAILTLGNGKQIGLNNTAGEVLLHKAGFTINQSAPGQIKYEATRQEANTPISTEYNRITTPQAGQYQVTLSDGTKVWLNSNSSIRFPGRFTGKERKVELSGEAFFEVAENKKAPFRVVAGGQTVNVLGTHFNINAYPDENAVKTTLVEGSLKVSKGTESVLLKPGQQALAKRTIEVVAPANLDAEISWKSGMFCFENADIDAVMRQAARWYNLEVSYQGNIPPKHFNGKIPRNTRLSAFLEMLRYSGVNVETNGRKITITQ